MISRADVFKSTTKFCVVELNARSKILFIQAVDKGPKSGRILVISSEPVFEQSERNPPLALAQVKPGLLDESFL